MKQLSPEKDFGEPDVLFYEGTHTYYHRHRPMVSGTKFVSAFMPPFDRHWMSSYKAVKEMNPKLATRCWHSKDLSLALNSFTPDEMATFFDHKYRFLYEWEMSAWNGTKLHTYFENKIIEDGGAVNPFTGKWLPIGRLPNKDIADNHSLCTNLYDLPDGVYTELLIFNLDWGIAGQGDLAYIETKGKKRLFYGGDYKTDNKKPTLHGMSRCLPPVDNYYDGKLVKYILQFSIYARMMEAFGFKVGGLSYTWAPNYDPEEIFWEEVVYDKKSINKMLGTFGLL